MIYKIILSGLFLYFIINNYNYKNKLIVKTKYVIDIGDNILLYMEGEKQQIKYNEFIETIKIKKI
jgi:hypothetical protein